MSLRPTILAVAALLGAAACRDPGLSPTGCREDKDCGAPVAAFRCEPRTGECYCRTNDACPPRQFCNTAGFCQDRSGCEKNDDCLGSGLFCDTTSGQCLSRGRCAIDLHCPLGQVCDLARTTCVDGCRTNGDCPGSSCRCGAAPCSCNGQTQAELGKCPVGECDPNFCADDTFCRFGELCGLPPDAGPGTLKQCFSDFDPDRRPYCANCTNGGGTDVCGTGANYCLIDTRNVGSSFCGADCSAGQPCPRGYGCSDIIVVFGRWSCTSSAQCPADPSLPCAADTDCKRGGHCVKASGAATGSCAGTCRIREGAAQGFCSCQVDNDCAQESCSAGECSISRRKCVTTADCRTIHCVDFRGSGGCLIGQNCAPANGLSCVEVQ